MDLAEAPPGEPFGRYTLHQLLGTGGMAEVFLASYDLGGGFEKLVVLKRILGHLSRDARFIAMFVSEARLAARIRHPNVVQIHDLGQLADRHFIVMEYVQGWDLSWLLHFARRVGRPFPLHIAAAICAQVAAGLDAAHSAADLQGQPSPIIHRDVSPHNVLVSRDGAIKLTDFGIAKAANNGALTPTATVKGKLSYLAPEVALASERIDPRADLFPLGIILCELVTLTKLFRRNSDYATMQALLHEPIPPLRSLRADVPPLLSEITARALARDPRARYPSAGALQRDLETFVESTGRIASPRALAAYVCQLATDAALAAPRASSAPPAHDDETGDSTIGFTGAETPLVD
jgi:serine/threonine-protein kinase